MARDRGGLLLLHQARQVVVSQTEQSFKSILHCSNDYNMCNAAFVILAFLLCVPRQILQAGVKLFTVCTMPRRHYWGT
jgi:hypothetical protein